MKDREKQEPHYIATMYPRKELPRTRPDALSENKSNLVRLDGAVAMRTRGRCEYDLGTELIKSFGMGAATFKYLYAGRNNRETVEKYELLKIDNGFELKKSTIRKTDEGLNYSEKTRIVDKSELGMIDRQMISMTNSNDEFYEIQAFSPSGGNSLTEDIDIGEEFRNLKSRATKRT